MSDNTPKSPPPSKMSVALLPVGIALVTVGITVGKDNRPLKFTILGLAIVTLLFSMIMMIRSVKSGSSDK